MLYRQINDKGVRETIDFLLNREEAHNALFREALNRMQDEGSMNDFGVTEDSKLYFDLSTPGRYFEPPRPNAPRFENPRTEGQGISQYQGERVQPMGQRAHNPTEAQGKPLHYR